MRWEDRRLYGIQTAGELIMDLAFISRHRNDNKAHIVVEDLGTDKITQRHSYQITVNF
jgi:hypothetical protein